MSLDILGPANTPGAVTTRPPEDRTFGTLDSWFKDCINDDVEDGTEYRASFFNGLLAALRNVWRMNGATAAAASVVPDSGSDEFGLVKSLQHLVQRGAPIYAPDFGIVNNIGLTLSPALAEYLPGLTVCTRIAATNTGPVYININGMGPKAVLRADGMPCQPRDLVAGMMVKFSYDGTVFQILGSKINELNAPRSYYVSNAGSDTNVGDLTHPFLTIQRALLECQIYNQNGFKITINVAAGTYAKFTTVAINGAGSIDIIGAGVGTSFISSSNGAAATFLHNGYYISGFTYICSGAGSGTPASGIYVAGCKVVIGPSGFGNCAYSHFYADLAGDIMIQGNVLVAGGCAGPHVAAAGNSLVRTDILPTPQITFQTSLSFNVFVFAKHAETRLFYSAINNPGYVSGWRYYSIDNSIIDSGGNGPNYYPGNSPGQTATGGQYV